MSDGVTRVEHAAAHVGAVVQALDARALGEMQEPLAADRAVAVARIEQWQQAAATMVPLLKRWRSVIRRSIG
jgi:hypothetical protein